MSDVLDWILREKVDREKRGVNCDYVVLSYFAIKSLSKVYPILSEGDKLLGMTVKYDFDRPLFGIE